jgi:hypothetical protein
VHRGLREQRRRRRLPLMKLVVADAAIVDSSAVPSAPPTCWAALTVAEATPESCGSTPRVALFIAVAKMKPRPTAISSSPGRIPLA